MTTTNLFALREARSNPECCFFRSSCPLGMSRHGERETNRRQPPAADGLDQSIRRQAEQAQRRKRQARVNEASQAKACPATKESIEGMNTYSGVSPIGRTSGPGNTVVSYAPWDFWVAPASDGKKTQLHAQRPRATQPLPDWVGCEGYTIARSFKIPDVVESTLLVSPPIHCQDPEGAQHQPKHSGQGGIHQRLSRGRFLWRHSLHAHACHSRTLRQRCGNQLSLQRGGVEHLGLIALHSELSQPGGVLKNSAGQPQYGH